MYTVPSAVICGVTSSSSTASTNCTETVLFTIVETGILVPCFTVAFSLFCVITLGFESNLPTPRSSAAVMIKSSAKFAELKEYEIPLVGAPVGKFDSKGMLPDEGPELPPVPTIMGGAGVWVIGLVPTDSAPPRKLVLPGFAKAMPNCVPISREKERFAATTRIGRAHV